MYIEQYISNIKSIKEYNSKLNDKYYVVVLLNDDYIKINAKLYYMINAIIKNNKINSWENVKENIADELIYNDIIKYFIDNNLIIPKKHILSKIKDNIKLKGFSIEIYLFSSQVLNFLLKKINLLFQRKFYLFTLFINIIIFIKLYNNYIYINFLGYERILILLGIVGIMIMHELGHLVACNKYEVNTGRIGIGLYIFIPRVFVKIIDISRQSKVAKISIDFGGVYFQMIYNIILFILYYILNINIFLYLIAINTIFIFINILPFLKLDGFWIVTDFFEIKNIHYRFVKSYIESKNEKKYLKILLLIIYIFTLLLNFIFFYNAIFYLANIIYKLPINIELIFNKIVFIYFAESLLIKIKLIIILILKILYSTFLTFMLIRFVVTTLKQIVRGQINYEI